MEVNGIRMGSNIHHRAHRKVIPTVAAGANSQLEETSMKYRVSDNIGPSGINHRLIVKLFRKSPHIIRELTNVVSEKSNKPLGMNP